jgi:hypothetical protein
LEVFGKRARHVFRVLTSMADEDIPALHLGYIVANLDDVGAARRIRLKLLESEDVTNGKAKLYGSGWITRYSYKARIWATRARRRLRGDDFPRLTGHIVLTAGHCPQFNATGCAGNPRAWRSLPETATQR